MRKRGNLSSYHVPPKLIAIKMSKMAFFFPQLMIAKMSVTVWELYVSALERSC